MIWSLFSDGDRNDVYSEYHIGLKNLDEIWTWANGIPLSTQYGKWMRLHPHENTPYSSLFIGGGKGYLLSTSSDHKIPYICKQEWTLIMNAIGSFITCEYENGIHCIYIGSWIEWNSKIQSFTYVVNMWK